jgi:hypothetical protein
MAGPSLLAKSSARIQSTLRAARASIMVRSAAFIVAAVIAVGTARSSATAGPTVGEQRIAVTIDDLPWNGVTAPGESVREATQRLLTTLVSRGIPAVGFVNCARTRADDPILDAWLVEHLSAARTHFTAVARSVAGRDVAHVLLVHANALAADHLAQVLDDYRAGGAVFVRLAEALSDPIYSLPDRYIGAKGLSWLYRIDPDNTRAAQAWDDQEASTFEQQYGR